MNKLRLDFNLSKSTTAEIFRHSICKWLSKPISLYSQARGTFITDNYKNFLKKDKNCTNAE